MVLCKECNGFATSIGGPYIGDHYLHQPNFQLLKQSSNNCKLCQLILGRFDETDQTTSILEEAQTGYPTAITFVGIDKNGPWKYYSPLYSKKNVWKGLVGIIVNCGEAGRNDDWSCGLGIFTDRDGDIAGLRIEDHSGSAGSMRLIQNWVDECVSTHVECLPSSSLGCTMEEALSRAWQTRLPTRVIDVGPPDGSQNPFLYATNGKDGTYVSLSHCWGKAKLFTTTVSTLQSRHNGFTVEMLPKTFQDAIMITRGLDIRYLWIDSLCIIQDSTEDWSEQSSLMADIYANAFLTIAATASPDCQTGCLFQRTSRPSVTITYSPPSRPSETGRISFHADQQYQIDPLRKSPLNTRGWTVQERILSRRTIHFASEQLFWDCHHSFLSENGVYAKQTTDSTNNPLRQSLHLLEFYGPDLTFNQKAFSWKSSILGRWMELVSEFTRRELTYDSDALPALAGVVSRITARTGDSFLAGLWRESLHIELLWMAVDAPHKAPKAYRAPSWSWAELVGQSMYYNYADQWNNFVKDLEILDVDVRWTGEAVTSLLVTGSLRVKGLLEPAHCVNDPSFYVLDEVESFPLVPVPALGEGQSEEEVEERVYGYKWAVFDQVPPPEDQILWCLCVCRRRENEYWCIILEKGKDDNNTYRRIGVARIDLKSGVFGSGERVQLDII